MVTSDYFSFSSLFLFFVCLFAGFFVCQETTYRKVAYVFSFPVLKKSSGAINHSFLSNSQYHAGL